MTVYAIAAIVQGLSIDTNGNYVIPINWVAQSSNGLGGGTFSGVYVTVPINTSPKKADLMIRQAVADAIAAASPPLIIDPSDIYFPNP